LLDWSLARPKGRTKYVLGSRCARCVARWCRGSR
jgi:hypothetical protein